MNDTETTKQHWTYHIERKQAKQKHSTKLKGWATRTPPKKAINPCPHQWFVTLLVNFLNCHIIRQIFISVQVIYEI